MVVALLFCLVPAGRPLPGRASGRVGHEEGDPERSQSRPKGYSAGGGGSIVHASMGRTAPGQSPTYGPRTPSPAPELRSTTWKETASFSSACTTVGLKVLTTAVT